MINDYICWIAIINQHVLFVNRSNINIPSCHKCLIAIESRKRKRATFFITRKLDVLPYQDLHSKASQQAVAHNFVTPLERHPLYNRKYFSDPKCGGIMKVPCIWFDIEIKINRSLLLLSVHLRNTKTTTGPIPASYGSSSMCVRARALVFYRKGLTQIISNS